MKQLIKDNDNKIAFIIVSMVMILIHTLKFNTFGYYVDEIGSMYDAYCIANFGVDRWLNPYPIHFLNYGDGQNASFVYILAILFKIFGYEKWVVRLVPLIFIIILTYYTGKLVGLYNKKLEKYGYIICLILPVFRLLFQFGLESHFMLPLSTMFIYYLCKGIKEKKLKYFIISGIVTGLVFHTYVLSYIVVPIFIIAFLTIMLKRKQVNIKQCIYYIIPVLIFGIPLLIVQIINIFDLEQFTILGVTFPKFLFYRGNELSLNGFFKNIYNAFINTNFYENTFHLCIPKFGNIYYVSIPFVIIGFIINLKQFKKNNVSTALILWTICMYILAGLLQEVQLNNTRLNAIYLPKIIYLIDGLKFLCTYIKKYNKVINYIIITIYSIFFILFLNHYISSYDLSSQYNIFMELYEDLEDTEKTTYLPDNYCYFVFSKKISPYDFDIYSNGYTAYKNYFIGYQNFDTNSQYLISKEDTKSINMLNKFGYTIENELKHFYIFNFKKEGNK